MKIRKLYSFKEIIAFLEGKEISFYNGKSNYAINFENSIYGILQSHFSETSLEYLSFINNGDLTKYAKEVIHRVVARFGNDIAVAVRTCPLVESNEKLEDESIMFLDSFTSILSNTYDKYSFLLSLYENKKDSLLTSLSDSVEIEGSGETSSQNQSTSSGKAIFNDTPQNEYSNEDSYETDKHSTNKSVSEGISNGSSSSSASSSETRTRTYDNQYLINRIDSIDKMYQDLLLRWSNEFSRLFTGVINYEE